MDFNRSDATVQTRSREVNEGLRKHMNSIYAKMSGGVLVTAIVAMVVGSSPMLLQLFLGSPQKYLVMFAPLAIIWFGFRPDRMAASKLMMAFFGVAIVYGISFSAIAAVATQDPAFAMAVARAFFIATIMFAGLSILGYTTKKDLSGMQTFLSMAILGLVAFSVMNIFFKSDMLTNLVAGAGILIFSGLTVFETQNMKRMYSPNNTLEIANRMAWASALNLYISFIAMFQYILHFLQQR
ncbi:MAG: Bax inhibitor-1/YccA family protein [Alphaproteobacteria bacterium]|nr:Bax inhibitor-1/YccA family protein [Alphaproteobacteria bacterium]NCQ88436.1 Bax inhibitor-1/YccA family protein [Alphaproteobacteria bacterium]NCT05979.1 Bax inhibitor-1/YccA family protein [Alphaproteobacteria bacterium]